MTGRVQKIRLESSLGYEEKVLDFNALLLCMLTSPVGSDGFVEYHMEKAGNSYNLTYAKSGYRDAENIKPMEDYDLVIPSGTYYFEEYPDLSEESILANTMKELLGTRGKDKIFVRLYKKNSLECVLQGMRPI